MDSVASGIGWVYSKQPVGGHADAIIRVNLDHGIDMNVQDDDGHTLLDLASTKGQVEIAHILLEHGMDATAQDDDGITPLHVAAAGDIRNLHAFFPNEAWMRWLAMATGGLHYKSQRT